MRKSLSKLKKDFKHRLGGKKRAADTAGANPTGETASSSLSPARLDSPQPKPMQADKGGDNPRGREPDVDEEKASQNRLRLGPDIGGTGESSLTRGIKRTLSPPSVTPISPRQDPDGTWTFSPRQLFLIILLDNADTPAVPGRAQGDPRPDENSEPSAAANEKKSSWKSTALATAKLLLRGVRDSADAFGPLKSVAGGLCFILENCEVWSNPYLHYRDSYRYPSE